MRRLFHRRADAERDEIGELTKLLRRLSAASARTRVAVGAGVTLANSEFLCRFGEMESFRRISSEQQRRFHLLLGDLELDLRNHGPGMALGVGLYRIWLADALAGRKRAAELLGQELAELSRKAAGLQPLGVPRIL